MISPDESVRDSVQQMLSGEPFQVLPAETGQQALRMLREHPLDVVVLDHQTPLVKRSGPGENTKVIEAIIDASPFLPVVLACESAVKLEHRMRFMADLIITRPIQAAALHEALDTVLSESLRERALRKAGGLRVPRMAV